MSSYPQLFSPLEIGGLPVRNRLVATAQITHYARDGTDSRRDRDYLAAKARGGVGLIIVGNRLVHPTSTQSAPRFPWGYLPDLIPSQRRVTEAVHAEGAAIIAQVNHFGLNGSSDAVDDLRVLWGPSAVKSPANGELPKVMEREDIAEIVDFWGRTAENMREAGFDGVEVYMGHSYLLHRFLSPIWNKRSDEYGGSFENRLRPAREVVAAVRRRVGLDYVVGIRVALSDYMDGGLQVEEVARAAAVLEDSGPIDLVNVTAGGYDNLYWAPAPLDIPDGWLIDMVSTVKSAVAAVPVFAVGGIKDAGSAEGIIASGKADMVAMTRAQIADPEFATKAMQGREGEIYYCTRCNQACIGRLFKGTPAGCTINPVAGRESRFGTLTPAESPANWLVAGGGPAGMKAAETLAKRGHQVTLFEREERLGGQVNLILATPGRETFGWVTRDLEVQMGKHGVDVRLGEEATADVVLELAPDGVIVATGATPSRSEFSTFAPFVDRLPGADQDNVVTAWEVLQQTREVGDRVVVLEDDDTRYAAGVAEVLLDRGKHVALNTPWTSLFPFTLPTLEHPIIYGRLFEQGLSYHVNSWARELSGDALTMVNLYTGAETLLEGVETLVLLTGLEASEDLCFSLKGRVQHLRRIGDCLAPRRLDHAIYEAILLGESCGVRPSATSSRASWSAGRRLSCRLADGSAVATSAGPRASPPSVGGRAGRGCGSSGRRPGRCPAGSCPQGTRPGGDRGCSPCRRRASRHPRRARPVSLPGPQGSVPAVCARCR